MLSGPRVTVTHERSTTTTDAMGGHVPTWATVESFDAILAEASGDEKKLYQKDTNISLYRLYVEVINPSNTTRTITPADRFTMNSGSRVLEILDVRNPFELNMFYRVLLQETR